MSNKPDSGSMLMRFAVGSCVAVLALAVSPTASGAGAEAAAPPVPATVFANNCAACHLASGQGVPGVFPALAGNALVQGDPAALVAVILSGRAGMPSFRNELNDAELAAAATHIRSSWGNVAGAVAPDFIGTVRVRTNNLQTERPVLSN